MSGYEQALGRTLLAPPVVCLLDRYKLQIKAKGVEKTSKPTISWGDVESLGVETGSNCAEKGQ